MKKYRIVLIANLILSICFVGFAFAASGSTGNTDTNAVADGINRFSIDLYNKLISGNENIFFSPYSISTALAMTYAGAKGKTEQEMANTMHFPFKQDKLHKAYSVLMNDLNAKGKAGNFQLLTANQLWGQKGYKFLESFIKITGDLYKAELVELDFEGDTENSRLTINRWAENKTQGKIKDLLARGILTADTLLILTNAIYFKGNWDSQFKTDMTHEGTFTTLDGSKIEVPLMHQLRKFNYAQSEGVQILEMPYTGKQLSMIVLLPEKTDGLSQLEKMLTVDRLKDWLSKLKKSNVRIFLPKFKVTCGFGLADKLQAMGMKLAFSPAADFSGMNGARNLYISAVIHKAFVEVNEEGTEAAASTAVIMMKKNGGPKVNVFRADHPFIFFIRDNNSGIILFMGRITNPLK